MRNKIFISHSSDDVEIVKLFVEKILDLGLDIPSDRIFCSSMEGYGIQSGKYIPDTLKEEINKTSLALLFISKNYKESEVCLNEVGAAWAILEKENIIPLLLPGVNFSELGFLDINRLCLKIHEKNDIIKLIQDCKENLNPNYNLEKLNWKIEEYLNTIDSLVSTLDSTLVKEKNKEVDPWTDCFTNNLIPLNVIIRRAIPALNDGIHKISDKKIQNQLLIDLSKANFLKDFWYKQAEGDYYVEYLKRLPSGNWLISKFNWEIKISDMWVSMNTELQYEFILINVAELEPFKIDTDLGGVSYSVGILNDGTIISENERLNGYAILNEESIDINEYGVEPRIRNDKSHWVFLVSDYHKLGSNANETIDFCRKLDKGEIEVNEVNLFSFLMRLKNHRIVTENL